MPLRNIVRRISRLDVRAGLRLIRRAGLATTLRATVSRLRSELNDDWLETTGMDAVADAHVLFVTSTLLSASHVYRVENPIMELIDAGIPATFVTVPEFSRLSTLPAAVRTVVFWRTAVNLDDFPALLDARAQGVQVYYDTDDLTFDEETYHEQNVSGLKPLNRRHRWFLMGELLQSKQRQIRQSDGFVGSTAGLVHAAIKFNNVSLLIPNFVPRWMVRNASHLRTERRDRPVRGAGLAIVYPSGTASHDVDFASAIPALVSFLRDEPESSLTIIGEVGTPQLDRHFRDVASQVHFRTTVPHLELLAALSDFDVAIAPLEMGNPFVESKSPIRFFHAGILGIPTIASPVPEFASIVKHGQNGWLAKNGAEWRRALDDARDRTIRERLGSAALTTTLDLRDEAVAALMASPIARAVSVERSISRRVSKKPTIVWILPGLPLGSGGHRNILRFASFLSTKSYHCVALVVDARHSTSELASIMENHYGTDGLTVSTSLSDLKTADIVFATHHSTVTVVRRYAHAHSRWAYLVQDFEPYFYPMGTDYLHARETYEDARLEIVCSGPWMADKIREVTGRSVPFFQFPVDKSIYFLGDEPSHRREGIAFFAKADTPRRLFDIGIRALGIVRRLRPDIPVTLFGSDSATRALAGTPFTVVGLLPELSDLADLYRRHRLGLIFSPTNPSLVPFEMMACGLVPIDVTGSGDDFPVYGSPPAAALARPNSQSVARQLIRLYDDEEQLDTLRQRGLAFTSAMPSEEDAGKVMLSFVEALLA